MNKDLCRETFEKWSHEQGWDIDGYPDARMRWIAWKAAWQHQQRRIDELEAKYTTLKQAADAMRHELEIASAYLKAAGHTTFTVDPECQMYFRFLDAIEQYDKVKE